MPASLAPLRPALLAAALLATAAPLRAQTVTQSDISGPIVTTGDLGGTGVRPARDAALVERGGHIRFARPAIACGVGEEGQRLVRELRAGTLADAGGRPLPSEAQAALLALATAKEAEADTAAVARYAAGLVTGAPASPRETAAALELARALAGLLVLGEECPDRRDLPASGARWERAWRAYARFVDAASPARLAAPPPYLLAAQALLDRGARAALDAAR